MDRGSFPRLAASVAVIALAALLILGAATTLRPGTAGTVPGVEVTRAPAPSTAATTTAASAEPNAGESAGESGAASPEASPSAATTSPPPPDPVLVGAGDIASCGLETDEATAALLDDIEGTVFTAGDNVYRAATRRTFEECFEPTWGRHKDRIQPAPGNHDWLEGLDAYLEYFGDAAVNEDGDQWYTWQEGTWQVIVLDSNCRRVDGCGPESPQGRWLAETLEASDSRCTLAIFHHPRFTSGEHGNAEAVAPFWDALYAAGADVIVNGHDHDYERFAPQDPSGDADPEKGIREFVVGTGGAGLREFADVVANSEIRASITHGVLALTLSDGSYAWEFHAVEDGFEDRGTGECH